MTERNDKPKRGDSVQLHLNEDGVEMQLGTSAGINEAEEVTKVKDIPLYARAHLLVVAGAAAARQREKANQESEPTEND